MVTRLRVVPTCPIVHVPLRDMVVSGLLVLDALTGVRPPNIPDRSDDQVRADGPTRGDDLASFLVRMPSARPGGDRPDGEGP